MRMNWRRHALAAALVVIVGSVVASAQDRDFTPVTDAMLENPDPADWLNWRRTLDGLGYSPLD
jgi:alcohol dehydrogenase (cytochrome c)